MAGACEGVPTAEDAKRETAREEYLLLLDTAKRLGREQAYLLAKVFASTGISVSELPAVTVEAVRKGVLKTSAVAIPEGLRQELAAFAARRGVAAGPVFVTRGGRPFDVQRVSGILRDLGAAAGLESGRSRPSALQKLYIAARSEAEAMAAGEVEKRMDEMADREQKQLTVDWGA